MRLFVAVELPRDVREAVERYVRSLAPVPGVRWSRACTHVTLRFLGDTVVERLPELISALSIVSREAFVATVAGAGQFPDRGRARVLWLGFTDPTPWAALVGAVDSALGIPADPRPFRPHVTLGRAQRGVRFPDALRGVPSFPSFRVEHITLFESTLGATAAHTPLRHFALGNVTQSSP